MRDGTEITPMDIASAKANGVSGVLASCLCGYEGIVPFGDMAETVFIPDISLRLKCSACGSRDVRTVPDWPRRIPLDAKKPGTP